MTRPSMAAVAWAQDADSEIVAGLGSVAASAVEKARLVRVFMGCSQRWLCEGELSSSVAVLGRAAWLAIQWVGREVERALAYAARTLVDEDWSTFTMSLSDMRLTANRSEFISLQKSFDALPEGFARFENVPPEEITEAR